MRKRYYLTGASGHLGTALARKLLARGDAVTALCLPDEQSPPEGVRVVRGDVRDPASLAPFFDGAGPDSVVLHCAGIVSISSGFQQAVYDVNVTGTKNVVEACRAHAVGRLVYVSSVHAIPEQPAGQVVTETDCFDPALVKGLYAKTKAEATAYVLAAAREGVPAVIVHPSGILGPYDKGHGHLTALVLDYCRRRLTAAVRGGYDLVDVRDVAAGVLAAAERGRTGACYILSNRYCTVHELLDTLHEITGQKQIKTYLPQWFVRATAPLSELYYKLRGVPPLYTGYSIYTLSTNANFSHEKADRELGYKTRPLEQTLRDTVAFLRSAGRLPQAAV